MSVEQTSTDKAALVARSSSIAALVVGVIAVVLSTGFAEGRLVAFGILGGVVAVVVGAVGFIRGRRADRILAGLGGALGVIAAIVGFNAI